MGSGRGAQVSMEFMMVMGIIFLLTVPLIILFFRDAQSSSSQIISAQVDQIARRIISAAETVQAFGTPTSVILRAYLPSAINSSSISGTDIVFVVNNNGKFDTIAESASVNISGFVNVNPGIHIIRVTAGDSSVNISDVSAPY